VVAQGLGFIAMRRKTRAGSQDLHLRLGDCVKYFGARFVGFVVFAAISYLANAMDNDPPQTIAKITTGWGGEGLYILAQNKPTLCSGTNYFIPTSAPMFKEVYAAVLAAYQSNGKVILNYDGCEPQGYGSLKAVSLMK
jgi:hypothetical protein